MWLGYGSVACNCNGFEVGVAGYVHRVDGSRVGASVLEYP